MALLALAEMLRLPDRRDRRFDTAKAAYEAQTLPIYLDALISDTWRADAPRYRQFTEKV